MCPAHGALSRDSNGVFNKARLFHKGVATALLQGFQSSLNFFLHTQQHKATTIHYFCSLANQEGRRYYPIAHSSIKTNLDSLLKVKQGEVMDRKKEYSELKLFIVAK